MNYRSLWTILAVGMSILPLEPALAADLRIGVVPGAYGDSVAKAAEIARQSEEDRQRGLERARAREAANAG